MARWNLEESLRIGMAVVGWVATAVSFAALTDLPCYAQAVIVPFGSGGYKYTTSAPVGDFSTPTFDDSAWSAGSAPIGYPIGDQCVSQFGSAVTLWPEFQQIWIRKTISLTGSGTHRLQLSVRHDDRIDGTLPPGWLTQFYTNWFSTSQRVACGQVETYTLTGSTPTFTIALKGNWNTSPAGFLFFTNYVDVQLVDLGLVPPTLSIGGGNSQTAQAGQLLPSSLVVKTTDSTGSAVNNIPISFQITTQPAGAQGASLSTTSANTQGGSASTQLTLGNKPGQYQVTASCPTCTPTTVVFTETAIAPPLVLGCPTSTGTTNTAYASAFAASGGTPPYTSFGISSGSLPTGLTQNGSDVAGTPTAAGTFPFTGTVTDSASQHGSASCSITIAPQCTYPTAESILSLGWNVIEPTKLDFLQTMSNGAGDSFAGRTVQETTPNPVDCTISGASCPDTCWYPGGPDTPFVSVTGGTIDVDSGNSYPDKIGWSPKAVFDYSKNRAPCHTRITQVMAINNCNGGFGFTDYISHTITVSIDATSIRVDKDGVFETKTIGDVNGNGVIDCVDAGIVRASFGKKAGQPNFDPRADVNGDGIVDVRDLSIVSQKLPAGTRCQ